MEHDEVVFNPRNDEPAFTTRSSNEVYIRQESLGIVRDQTVLVVGCGGIGSWMGYFLGLAGVERLHLFDGDTIEAHNLNRLPFTPADVGRYKSEALADLIAKARSDVNVNAYGNFDPRFHANVLAEADAVVVSTDSLKSRRMVHEAIGRQRYYELGADGHGLTVTGEPADWSTPAEEQEGYRSVPIHVGPCTLAASIASYYVLMARRIEETFRVDWDGQLRINVYQGV